MAGHEDARARGRSSLTDSRHMEEAQQARGRPSVGGYAAEATSRHSARSGNAVNIAVYRQCLALERERGAAVGFG
jgi:hypothetical protein